MSGYKVVPVEPTPEMVSEGARHLRIMSLPAREAASVYQAMLAAAPAVQGEPVAWLTMSTNGDIELAEPYEKATNPAYWSDAFPVYAAPQPPFQLPDFATDPDDSDEVASLWDHGFKRGWNSCLGAVAKAMQPATPDVAGLVEALERIASWPNGGNRSGQTHIQMFAAKTLAAYRKQGEV